MAGNRTPRFMNLFSPERRSARTKRWRKRFPKFSLSSWHSSRIVESVCGAFQRTAEASRLVRRATGSHVVSSSIGKSLRLEGLENRAMLSAVPFTGAYEQDFNSLPINATQFNWTNETTTDVEGWSLFNKNGGAIDKLESGDGSSLLGGFYSFGSTGSPDLALGGLGLGTPYFGEPANGEIAGWMAVALQNVTGTTINTLDVEFDGEQWRSSDATAAQTMVLEYGFGATFAGVMTWAPAGTSFNFVSPTHDGTAQALDGNATPNRVEDLGGTLTTLNWTNNSTLWLRWVERNDVGFDHGLAIDNLSISAAVSPPTVTGSSFEDSGTVDQSGTVTLSVTFNETVVGADSTANYTLVRGGADGLLGTGDDVNIPISSASFAGTTATLNFPSMGEDVYRLTVSDAIVNGDSVALDGDGDGAAGGDYIRDFVKVPAAGVSNFIALNQGGSAYNSTVGDFDNDGLLDVAYAAFGSAIINYQTPSGGYGAPVSVGGAAVHDIATADFNKDGWLDLVGSNSGSGARVTLNNGSGGFGVSLSISAPSSWYSVVTGDFNGDANPDFAIAGHPNQVRVFFGNGAGAFPTSTTLFTPAPLSGPNSGAIHHIAAGDVNNDGHTDLVTANMYNNATSVFLGASDGVFSGPFTFNTTSTGGPNTGGSRYVTIGDVNLDGNPDLVVADPWFSSNGVVTVLLGNGTGTSFTSMGGFSTGGHRPYSVAIVDYDGDTLPDLVAANRDNSTVTLLRGNGTGLFTATPTHLFSVGSAHEVVATDLNRDGRPDLVISGNNRVVLHNESSPAKRNLVAPSFVFDVDPTTFGAGGFVHGASDASFDSLNRLQVDGADYAPTGFAIAADSNRTIATAPATLSGLTVSREVFVPGTGSENFARTLNAFTNPTASSITVTVKMVGNLGSDAGTGLFATSDGDATLETTDRWFGTDDADGSGTPSIVHLVRGLGGLEPTSVQVVGDNVEWTYDITVAPGATERLASFTILGNDRAAAIAAVNALLTPSGFGGEAAAFLTPGELASIANFQPNSPPEIEDQSFSVAEDDDGSASFGSVVASDEQSAVTYALTGGTGMGLFEIDANSGALAVDGALDYETADSYTLTVEVTDAGGLTDSATITVNLTDVDEFDVTAPVDADGAADELAENATVGTAVGITASASDADGTTNAVTYSLQDELGAAADAGGLFQIDATSGIVTLALANLDYEAAADHEITVRATSADGSVGHATFSIAVADVDEFDVTTPVDADGAANEVAENATVGTQVGITAAAGDDDGTNNTITYSLVNDAGGLFDIDGSTGVVMVAGALDYESGTSHMIRVRATSADGSQSEADFVISVTDVDEFDVMTPVENDAAADAVDENAAAATPVGITAFASDADATNNTVTYSLTDDAGGRFQIDANTGVVTTTGAAIDRETDGPSLNITVQAASTDGSTASQTFAIAIGDVDEFDVTAVAENDSAADAVNENSPQLTAVGITAFSSDADATNNTVTYSLTDDAGGRFQINGMTGVVTTGAVAIDRESDGPSLSITVLATSSDGSAASETFAIAIGDVDEFDVATPVDSDGAANAVDENTAAATPVGIAAFASDADATTNSTTYSLTDDAGGRFQIDANTGIVTTTGASIDRETDGPALNITVLAASSDGSTASETFAIAVGDVDEFDVIAPVDNDAATNAVDENAAPATPVGIAAFASDADATNNTVTYSLTDDAGGRFQIDSTTGVVTTGATNIDRETDGDTLNITVQAASSDGSTASQTFAIAIGDMDEFDVTAPLDADGAANQLAEDAAVGTAAGITASSSDPDSTTNVVTYSLVDGFGNPAVGGLFAVDANTGVVTLNAALDYEAATSHSIIIRATSADGSFADTSFNIAVLPVNDNSPIITSGDSFSVNEEGTAVTTVTAADADLPGDTLAYSISGGADGSLFSIDGSTGALTFSAAPNFENPADQGADNVYQVEVSVSDQVGGIVATQLITVTVQDVSETMVVEASGNLRLERDGAYVQLVDATTGTVVLGSRHLFANVTSTVVNGDAATDDTLIVDFSSGLNPVAPGGLTFHGGAGGHDTIEIDAAGFHYNTIAWNYTNASDGSIELDHASSSFDGTISYTGLEPVVVNDGTVDDAEFNLPNGAEAVLEDAGGGNLRLRSTNGTFEDTTFPAPADSLTINGDAKLTITTAVTVSTEIALNVSELTLNADLTAPSLVGTATIVTVDDVPALDPAQIQDAIDVAASGAIVSVLDGLYNESLTIAKNITLAGDGDGITTLDAGGATTAIFVGGGSSVVVTGLGVTNFSSNGIRTQGDLTLIDSTVSGGLVGVWVDGGTLDMQSTIVTGAAIFGVQVSDGGDAEIAGSEITGSGTTAAGVIVSDGNADIIGSKLTGNSRGLLVNATGTASVTGSDLSNNSVGGVVNATATAVDASGNWWGVNTETAVDTAAIGTVDFTPFLNSGADTDGGARGFDGDVSHVHVTSLGAQIGSTGRIQEGVNLAADPGTVTVHDGVYDETIVVNKSLTLQSFNEHGAQISPTTGSQQSVVSINAADVTIDGFAIQVNQNDDGSIGGTAPIAPVGIAAVGTTMDGLVLSDNLITSIGDNASVNWTGSPGLTVRAAGIVLNDAPSGNIPSVEITGNEISITSGTSFFQRAVWLSQLNADITGNTLAGFANDLIFQFASGGPSLIEGNTFEGLHLVGGAGVVIADPNGSSPITIHDNNFATTGTAFPSTALQVNRNVNGTTSPIIIDDNDFAGFRAVGVDIGGAGGVTVSGNTFTSADNAIGFTHVIVDSQNASNNASIATAIDAQIFGNTFNVAAGAVGTAILAENNLPGAAYAPDGVQIGVGGSNTYASGLTTGVSVLGGIATVTDNITGAGTGLNVSGGTTTLSGSALAANTTGVSVSGSGVLTLGSGNDISGATTGMLFSGPSVGLTSLTLNNISIDATGDYITLANGAFDDQELDATGATLGGVAVASMSNAQKFAASNKITDEIDDNTLGLVELDANVIYVTPVAAGTATATNNDYTRIANALGAADDGDTILLGANGGDAVFNWDETNALASWQLGNDGVDGTDDDWAALLPDGLDNVTISANAADEITIQGPGDVADANLEGVFVAFDNGTNTGWTFENFNIFDVDNAIGFYYAGDDFSGLTIDNMHIRVAADSADDANQNIGIHFGRGTNIHIVNSIIDVEIGDGATVGVQSNTHGGANYDGLLIDNNTINVTGAGAGTIIGVWENGHAHASDITVSNNTFNGTGDPAATNQTAFRITSHSGASTTVSYSGNTIDNAAVGFKWLDEYASTPQDYSGTQAVQITDNTLTDVNTGVSIGGINASAILSGNTLANSGLPANSGSMAGVGVGVDVLVGATAIIDGSPDENTITGFATGVQSAGALVMEDNDASISSNAVGIDVISGTATVTNNHIHSNTVAGVRINDATVTITSSSIHDNGVGVQVEGTSTLVMTNGSVDDNATNGLLVLGDGTLQSITVEGTSFSGNAANGPLSSGQGDITLFEFASATPSVASFTDVTVTSDNPDYAIQVHGGAGEFANGPLDSSISANVSFDNVDILGTQNRMAMLIQQYADLSTFSFNDVTFNSAADGGLVIFDAMGGLDLGNTTFHDTYDAGDGAGNGTGFDIATSLNDVDATEVTFVGADKSTLAGNFAIEDRVGHAVDADVPGPLAAGFVNWIASGETYDDAVFLTVESFAPAVGSNSPSVARAIEVADAELGKDHVYIQQGNYVQNSQILIDSNVEVTGDTAGKPVITPGQNFTGNNAADAWILVDEGVTFSLDNVVLDGDGFFVWQALRSHGNTTVDNVDFRDIQGSASGSPYRGVAIQSFGGVVAGGAGADSHGGLGLGASHLVVTNSTFEDIGRIGVLVKGTGATADISGNTYTGKGDVDGLDYAFEIGAGGKVDLQDNTVSGNLGEASDGSTSAALLITTFYGAGSEAHLSGVNNFSGNTVGVHIGFDAADSSVVTIDGGSLSNNTDAGIHAGGSGVELTVSGVDLTGNNVGIFVENDAQVDAGGGGGSTGGNILTGYTGVGGNYAIENRNEVASDNVDVYAEGNAFGSTIPAVIEQVVFHTVDDPQFTQVFFGNPIAPPNTPFPPTVVFVDDDWAGSAVGSDADGAGGTLGNGQAFGYDQFASIQDAIDAVTSNGTGIVYVYGGTYAESITIDKTLDLLSELAGVDARGRSATNEAIITPAVADEAVAVVTIAAADVTVDGFTIDGTAGIAGGVTLADGITVSNAARGIAIDGDNAQVLNNRVQNLYRRGIQSWVTAAAAPVGGVVSQNEINNIGVATPDGFFSGDGILAFSPLVEVTDNDVNNATTGITFIQIYPTVPTSIEISGNTIDATSGIALNEISANTTMTVSGNAVTTGDGGVGLLLWTVDGSVSVDDSLGANTFAGTGVNDLGVYGWDGTANNAMSVTITGGSITGYEAGVHLTNEEGAFGPSLNNAALTLSGVDISTAAGGVGVLVEDTVAGAFAVTVNIQDDTDITTGGGTAVLVSGPSASANVIGNDASIHGNAVGVDVNGGSADVTGNHIFDNSIGVQFRNGGAGSVTDNNFDGATDNGTDVLVQASAGSVTIGDGNDFAGDDYFIDDQSTQGFDLSGHAATTYEGLSPSTLADAFRIEDKMFHGPDNGTSGVIRVVAGELFVTTNGTGDNDESIQNAIDVADDGDLVNVEAGTYTENVSISKDIDLLGDLAGGTTVTAASGNVFTVSGAGFGGDDNEVSISYINLDGNSGAANAGVHVAGTSVLNSLSLINADVSGFRLHGFYVDAAGYTGSNPTTSSQVQNVALSDLVFTNNGIGGGGGMADIQFFGFNNDATLTDLTVVGSRNELAGTGARGAIQFRGVGEAAGAGILPMGAVTFDNVDVSGDYRNQMIGIQRYSMVDDLSFNDVKLGGATSEITGTFGASLRFDAVGSGGTLATPVTVDLGNTHFRGLAPGSAQRHEIEFAPDNSHAFLRADGIATTWTVGGVDVAASSLTLPQAFEVEDRILHFVDKLNPTHGLTFGPYKGFVDVQAGEAFITDEADAGLLGDGSIQRGVDIVAAGGTVHVEAGSFTEAVNINKHVDIVGAGSGITVLNQPVSPNIFTLTASGASTADRLLIQGLQLLPTGTGTHGIYVPMTTSIEHIELDDVTVTGSSPMGPAITEIGFRITDSADVDDLVITNSLFENLNHGMLIEKHLDITGTSNVTNLSISDTGFEDNQSKGFYAEKLSDATFIDVWATGNGNLPFFVSGAGIEINLKGDDGTPSYQNLVFNNLTVTNNGLGTPTVGLPLGAGLQIKARGTGDTGGGGLYAANPAALTNVQINGGTFDGNRTGIRVGEPGQMNTSPTGVAIDGVVVTDSTETGIHIVGGTATVQGATLTNNPTGILVQGAGLAIVTDSLTAETSIAGGTVGIDVNAGTALVENADLNGNTIGVLVQNGGVADLGQSGTGDFTGLGTSAGGNDFTGYTVAATAASGAIVNLNSGGGYSAAGPQGYAGAEKDVAAFNNLWNDGSTAGIENVIWHDADDTNVGFIDYASLTNLVVSLEPLPTLVTNEDVSEGSSTTVFGQFTNDAQAHEVTINWGDGSPDTTVVLAAGVSTFAIASPATAYTDDPNGPAAQTILRNITVTVEEVATPTNSLTDTSLSVDVNNVIPDAPLSTLDGDLNEGETFTIDVGPAVDPGNDTISAYRINWGDGTNDVYVGNLSTISTHTHTYQDGLASPNVTVTLDIFDDDGTWNAVESLDILVHNIDPTADGGFFAFDAAVDEGSTTTVFFVGPFTDPGNPDSPFHFAYDFNGNGVYGEAGELGDGTYAGSSTSSSAVVPAEFLADDDDSPRTVRARIIDNDGGFTEYNVDIVINNVAPEVDAGADSIAFAGVPFMHTINFTDPGADAPWTVNVDWNGDGDFLDADESAFGVGGHSFTISHTYSVAEIGNVYNVAVQVDDGDGGVDSDVFQVTVVEDTFRVTDFVTYASGFDITFNHAADLDVLNLYSGQGGPITPPDVTVIGSNVGAVKGSIAWNPSTNTLSFVKTGGVLAADTYTVTLVSGDDAFQNTLGSDLDGDGDFTPGGDYTNAFAVTSSGERVVSIQDFARGAGQDVNLPIDTSPDFHVRIDNAAGVTAVDVDVVYDPALLNITAAAAAAGLPGGWSLTSNFVSPGLLKLTLSGTTPLVGSNLNLVRLVADVPASAPYGASQVIRLEELRVNEDAIASKADFAVHKAVYVGDADGDGQYLGFDASLISRVVVNLDSGFAAHDWTDPLIVADASGDGTLSGQDASLVAQEAALIDTPEIPPLPGIVLMPAVGGLDPTLSVPSQFAAPGDTVTVPVMIEVLAGEASDPTVVSATFDVFFNDSELALTVGDITQGGFWSVADDWSLTKNVVGGQARLVFFNSGGEQSLPGTGDIAYLSFTLDAGMTPGQVVNLDIEPASATEGGLTWTNSDGAIGVTYTADFDLDGDVDGDDLGNWQSGFGTAPAAAIADGDENRDGDVDGSDFLAWQRQLGSSVPPLAAASAEAAFAESSVLSFAAPSAAGVLAASESSDSLQSSVQHQASWWINEPRMSFGEKQSHEVAQDVDAAFDTWSFDDDRGSDSEAIMAVASEAVVERGDDSGDDAFDPFDEFFGGELKDVLVG